MTDTSALNAPSHPAPDIPRERLTPMFAQYLAVKKNHQDALLFYRMGDFYELFFDDAVVAAKALQITLTSRNPQAEYQIPMCGVPHHSHLGYVRRLTDLGFRVAICEQIEDPRTAKGLVKREVKRVATAGTMVEDEGLSAKEHNYLGALYWNRESSRGGFTWLDYSTGNWSGLYCKKEDELWQWARKMRPRELILPDLTDDELGLPRSFFDGAMTPVRLPLRGSFDRKGAEARILEAQGIKELGAVGLNGKDELVRACGALLGYLTRTQKQALEHLKSFELLSLSRHLIIDEVTERNLEIFRKLDGKKGPGTLWQILDDTISPMGGRLLEERLRHPWRDRKQIDENADIVQFFYDHGHKRAALRRALEDVRDLERLFTRLSINRGTPKDMLALGQSLAALGSVRNALEAPPPGRYAGPDDSENFPLKLLSMYRSWDDMTDVAVLLGNAISETPPPVITEGGLFKSGFNSELDELIDLVEHGEQRLRAL
ncbi:MAG: DNA mismatch repair protein MutS, partial [Desulfovibrio sp.]|nr:DNA mismatch repair protein MutS [Desulfovibrio sp.]